MKAAVDTTVTTVAAPLNQIPQHPQMAVPPRTVSRSSTLDSIPFDCNGAGCLASQGAKKPCVLYRPYPHGIDHLKPTHSRAPSPRHPLHADGRVIISTTDKLQLLKVQVQNVARICKVYTNDYIRRSPSLSEGLLRASARKSSTRSNVSPKFASNVHRVFGRSRYSRRTRWSIPGSLTW